MRTLFFSCVLALGIAVAIWFQQGSNEPSVSANQQAAAEPAPHQNAADRSSGLASKSKAGVTLRSTSIRASAENQPRASRITRAPEKSPGGETRRVPALPVAGTPAPKSAAELFSPFVEDDPSLVFPPSTVQYHSTLQSEPTDPDWGPSTAAALRNFIASQYGDRFEIPVLECRRDLCELQVAGRIGGDSEADMAELQRMMHVMKQSALWSSLQLDQETSLISTSSDGRAVWLSFISRL